MGNRSYIVTHVFVWLQFDLRKFVVANYEVETMTGIKAKLEELGKMLDFVVECQAEQKEPDEFVALSEMERIIIKIKEIWERENEI